MHQGGEIGLTKLPDNELIDRFRYSHDNLYIGELYSRYSHLVLGLCIKYFRDIETAKDATMSIFELSMRELKRHRIENFKSWLFTVSKNYCLQELRKTNSLFQKEELYKVFLSETMESDLAMHPIDEKEKLITKWNLFCLALRTIKEYV